MEQWKIFENNCYEYLKKKYTTFSNITFKQDGGSDSTVPDIAVMKNGEIKYYIETKMSNAQSGQFVLLPDEEKQIFIFSPRNKSKSNSLTDIIIEYMNNDFENFNTAGTAGKSLDIDSSIFSQWIIEYYAKKNVKYFMTEGLDYIVFPIQQFGKYFDITAKYRIKKSGSSEPAKKDIPTILEILEQKYEITKSRIQGKKLFVLGNENISKVKFERGKYTYSLVPKSENEFEVRKLSNTYNMNVIFSISLKKEQDKTDLKIFESDL